VTRQHPAEYPWNHPRKDRLIERAFVIRKRNLVKNESGKNPKTFGSSWPLRHRTMGHLINSTSSFVLVVFCCSPSGQLYLVNLLLNVGEICFECRAIPECHFWNRRIIMKALFYKFQIGCTHYVLQMVHLGQIQVASQLGRHFAGAGTLISSFITTITLIIGLRLICYVLLKLVTTVPVN
jgi:hypothetical protein